MTRDTERWINFVEDYIFKNYKNVEYVGPNREVTDGESIYNIMKFPKAENGRYVNRTFLTTLISKIKNDKELCDKIFGPIFLQERDDAQIIEDNNAFYIAWSVSEYFTDSEFGDINDQSTFYEDPNIYKLLYRWKI